MNLRLNQLIKINPFCCKRPDIRIIIVTDIDVDRRTIYDYYRIRCENCTRAGAYEDDLTRAIKSWNKKGH